MLGKHSSHQFFTSSKGKKWSMQTHSKAFHWFNGHLSAWWTWAGPVPSGWTCVPVLTLIQPMGGGETKTKHTSWIAVLEAQRSHFQVLSLGTNTIEMQLVWRIFPATSLVERIFPETSAFWRMLQATSLAMQDMLWNRFAEPQKHRTFQRLSVSPKMFGKKTNLLPVSYNILYMLFIIISPFKLAGGIQFCWTLSPFPLRETGELGDMDLARFTTTGTMALWMGPAVLHWPGDLGAIGCSPPSCTVESFAKDPRLFGSMNLAAKASSKLGCRNWGTLFSNKARRTILSHHPANSKDQQSQIWCSLMIE